MGLIQRAIELEGIPTIGISIVREYTEEAAPPRSIHLKWPFGHPLGEPFNRDQHHAVLARAFEALYGLIEPGRIVDIPFRWRKETYPEFGETM